MKTTLIRSLLLAPLALSFACDSQQSSAYEGEALWKLEGAIVTKDAEVGSDSTTGVLWLQEGSDMVLTELDVEGQFPAEFTLRAYEAPPRAGLMSLDMIGVPGARLGFGQLVAVDPKTAPFYPDTISTGKNDTEASDIDTWLRGGAPGHLVVYLDAETKPTHPCLVEFSLGYNLLELTEKTEAEVVADESCQDKARNQALAAYNTAQGTSFTDEDLWQDENAQDAVGDDAKSRACELGCDMFRAKSRLVSPDERVTLEMGPSVQLCSGCEG